MDNQIYLGEPCWSTEGILLNLVIMIIKYLYETVFNLWFNMYFDLKFQEMIRLLYKYIFTVLIWPLLILSIFHELPHYQVQLITVLRHLYINQLKFGLINLHLNPF